MTYIDPKGKLFAHLDKLAQWPHPPVTVEWDLSNRCTLGCQDCHYAHTHVKGPWASRPKVLPMAYDSTGDLANLELVMRGLTQAASMGVQGIVWSGGGEPTTHPHYLEAMAWARTLGLKQGMYTLGGLITSDALAHLADWVVVSLDCIDAETYTEEKGVPEERFHAACTGIKHIAGKTVVGVSFLLHEKNWMQVFKMLAFARSLGATYTTFRPTVKVKLDNPSVCYDDRFWLASAKAHLKIVAKNDDVELDLTRFKAYQNWENHGYGTCYGIRFSTVVTPDGRVWVCTNRRGMQNSCIGDLRKESFADVWKRHPGQWIDFQECRVMCKMHPVNEQLTEIFKTDRKHTEFL